MEHQLDEATDQYLELLCDLNRLVKREYTKINEGDVFTTGQDLPDLLDKMEQIRTKYNPVDVI